MKRRLMVLAALVLLAVSGPLVSASASTTPTDLRFLADAKVTLGPDFGRWSASWLESTGHAMCGELDLGHSIHAVLVEYQHEGLTLDQAGSVFGPAVLDYCPRWEWLAALP